MFTFASDQIKYKYTDPNSTVFHTYTILYCNQYSNPLQTVTTYGAPEEKAFLQNIVGKGDQLYILRNI